MNRYSRRMPKPAIDTSLPPDTIGSSCNATEVTNSKDRCELNPVDQCRQETLFRYLFTAATPA